MRSLTRAFCQLPQALQYRVCRAVRPHRPDPVQQQRGSWAATLSGAYVATIAVFLLHLAAPAWSATPFHKCVLNGAVTYQQSPCPSVSPREQPTVEQLNADRLKKLQQDKSTTSAKPTSPAAAAAPASAPPTPPSQAYKCDGRTRCSQMTSCAEAKYFLANCPAVQMDGDKDGIPCEEQWCH